MAHDAATGPRRGDERDRRCARGVQHLHQMRLFPTAGERPLVHFANGGGIFRTVRPDRFVHSCHYPSPKYPSILRYPPECVEGEFCEVRQE